MMVEQLRRTAAGGIGTYINGLLQGFDAWPAERPDARAAGQPVGRRPFGAGSAVPPRSPPAPFGAAGTGADPGVGPRDPPGARPASTWSTPPRWPPSSPGRSALVVTVHDLLWRRVPEAYPAAGPALARGGPAPGAAPGRPVRRACRHRGRRPGGSRGGPRRRSPSSPWGPTICRPPTCRPAGPISPDSACTGPSCSAWAHSSPRKNQARLIEAYGTGSGGHLPEPWPLVLVGPIRLGRAGGRATGVRPGRAGARRPSSPASTPSARLLAYVPLIEGFGLPPVEAMAFGTPVVASPLPSTAAAAFEVDPHDTDSIAAGLLRVATDDRERKRLHSSGWPDRRNFLDGHRPSPRGRLGRGASAAVRPLRD